MAEVILYGRPPVRPRARADASPAVVRSEMSSRSNSASAAKIPKTSLPAAVVVSIAAPWPVRTLSPTPRAVRSWTVLTRWVKVAPEPVEFPDDEGVAVPERFQARGESGAIIVAAGGVVVVEVGGIDAGGQERVVLEFDGLGSVCFGDAHVARPACNPSCHVYGRLRDRQQERSRGSFARHITRCLLYVMQMVRGRCCVTSVGRSGPELVEVGRHLLDRLRGSGSGTGRA